MGTAQTGNSFLKALEDAGVLKPEDKTRRVVIDATIGEPLMIYIENIGDERVLQLTTHPSLEIASRIRSVEMDDLQ